MTAASVLKRIGNVAVYLLALCYLLKVIWPAYLYLFNPGGVAFERGLKKLAEVQAFVPRSFDGIDDINIWLWDGGFLSIDGKLEGDPSHVSARFVGHIGEFRLWCRHEYEEHPSWQGTSAPSREDLQRIMELEAEMSIRDMIQNYQELLTFVSAWPREPGTNQVSDDDPNSDHKITDCWTEKSSVHMQDWIGPYDSASIFGRTRYIYVKERRRTKPLAAPCKQDASPSSAAAEGCSTPTPS